MSGVVHQGERVRTIALLIISLVLFLLFNMPASLIKVALGEAGVIDNRDQNVQLYQLHGTTWSGGADHVVINQRIVGGVEWEFAFSSLLKGRAAWLIKLKGNPEAEGTASVGLRWDGAIIAESVHAALPVETVVAFMNRQLKALSGKVKIDLSDIVLEPGKQFVINGKIEASMLRIGKEGLGGVEATIAAKEGGSKVVIRDQNKAGVALDLLAKIGNDGHYRLTGSAKIKEGMSSLVRTLFAWIGKRDGKDKYKIKAQGNLWSAL